MGRYEEVIAILDDAVGGSTEPVGRPHQDFWRNQTRDEFVALQVRGRGERLPLIVVGDGASSNLVKALKGEAPFGSDLPSPPAGSRYRRMPAGLIPVPESKIEFIKTWIDDGCPET